MASWETVLGSMGWKHGLFSWEWKWRKIGRWQQLYHLRNTAIVGQINKLRKSCPSECFLEAFWEKLWASSRMAHGLTELHSFNGNMYNGIPLLLPAELLQWAFSHFPKAPHEHAQVWQGLFVLNTMLVDIKLGQVVNIHSLSRISFQNRWAKSVLSDSLQFKDYISFQNQEYREQFLIFYFLFFL